MIDTILSYEPTKLYESMRLFFFQEFEFNYLEKDMIKEFLLSQTELDLILFEDYLKQDKYL